MSTRSDELQEALEQIDMEGWLDRQGIDYRVTRGSRGVQLNVKECPCCGNSKWKVYLNADNGLGNCFSGDCETKFNRWKFIKASLGRISDREAVEHVKAVAAEFGWQPPRKKSAPVQMASELVIPESIALPHQGRNLKYLDNRGITGAIADYFHLRFCKNGGFSYLGVDGDKIVQDYSGRVIIPIFDLEGKLVSFQGRDISGTAKQKYLFPPGYASTGAYLYNGHNAVGAESIVLNEGVFDVAAVKIAFDQEMALRNVIPVGTFGKHLSSGDEVSQMAKLLQLKEKGLKVVTLMWDGESRAICDAVDAALEIKKIGLIAKVAILPKGKDPNEVPASVVRQAYWKAQAISPSVAARLKIQYSGE